MENEKTVAYKWSFPEVSLGATERDSKVMEFFKKQHASEVLVREFIQNSLDARKGNEKVIVKITLGELMSDKIQFLFDNDFKKHMKECGIEFPTSEKLNYVVLEDFGTTGLTGDASSQSDKGNFYNFWWREGISEKDIKHRGRWGLGKVTFFGASKIRTIFGITVIEDEKKLLMGKSLFKTHKYNNKRYQPDGVFSDINYLPIEDKDFIKEICEIFSISRENKSGLSVIIPYSLDEITAEDLKKAVIVNYFYSIIGKELEIYINNEKIDNNSIYGIIKNIDFTSTGWENYDREEIVNVLKIFTDNSIKTIEIKEHNLKLEETIKNLTNINDIKESFRKSDPLKFRIYLELEEEITYFDILIKKTERVNKPFIFCIRSGITIPEEGERIRTGNRSVAAFLLAEDKKISEFLSSAETPAHESWSENTENFKEKYKEATKILRFIKKSFDSIFNSIDEPHSEKKIIWEDLFSVYEDKRNNNPDITTGENTVIIHGNILSVNLDNNVIMVRKSSGDGTEVSVKNAKIKIKGTEEELKLDNLKQDDSVEIIGEKSVEIIVAKYVYITDDYSRNYEIKKCDGGFEISGKKSRENQEIKITAAYDVLRSNPFGKYKVWDFDFKNLSEKNICTEGCEVLEKNENKLIIKLNKEKFVFRIQNFFDINRDVVVSVK